MAFKLEKKPRAPLRTAKTGWSRGSRPIQGSGTFDTAPGFRITDQHAPTEAEANSISRASVSPPTTSPSTTLSDPNHRHQSRKLDEQHSGELSALLQNPSRGKEIDPESLSTPSLPRVPQNQEVRLHTGPQAASFAASLRTPAFTVGTDIFFGRGGNALRTTSGNHIFRHELAHAMQSIAHPTQGLPIIQRFGEVEYAQIDNGTDLYVHNLLAMETDEAIYIINELVDNTQVHRILAAIDRYRIPEDKDREAVIFKVLVVRNALLKRLDVIEDTPFDQPIPSSNIAHDTQSALPQNTELSASDRKHVQAAIEQVSLTPTERALLHGGFAQDIDAAVGQEGSTKNKEKALQDSFEVWQKKLVRDPREKAQSPISKIEKAKGDQKTALIEEFGDLDTLKEKSKEVHRETSLALYYMTKAVIEQELAIHQETPQSWFSGIVPNARFLGLPIQKSDDSVAPGVHRVFLDRLQEAERILMKNAGLSSPEEAADFYGIVKITGLRQPKLSNSGEVPSLHAYGLAVDINGKNNPYIQEAHEDVIIQHATQLILGTEIKLRKSKKDLSVKQVFDEMVVVNGALHKYFALKDDPEAFAKAVADNGAGRSHEDWTKLFEEDLKLSDPDRSKNSDIKNVREPGGTLINFQLQFIEAMIAADISWGGMMHSPDTMHFDYRKSKLGMAGRS
jgi:hypothetical protein